ncbi:zinc finger protein RFP-like isoform X2 [Elgaria multicarinata webbii]|uniref:zinc finger protein RFP-like isoform X2 n=1 Tax=Elgaria multicarinata webbii TaxID=159646 RepID=UPI002FCCD153
MAAAEKLREEATCSICLEYFKEPVSLDCGHNFCHACIIQCWGSFGSYACPECREATPKRNFRTNRSLKNVVELVKTLTLEAAEAPRGEKGVCKKHQEPLKLFCRNDETPICVICRESRDHQSHVVHPIEEAAQDYKEQIQTELQKLKRKREKFEEKQLEGQATIKEHLKKIEVECNATVSEFEKLHQFEQEQKHLFLGKLKELKKAMENEQASKAANLSEEIGRLNTLIGEMEERWQQPGSEFLQDIKGFLRKDTTPSATSHQELTGSLPLQAAGLSVQLLSQSFSAPSLFGGLVSFGKLATAPTEVSGMTAMMASVPSGTPAPTPFVIEPRLTKIQEPVNNSDPEQRLHAYSQMNVALRRALAQFKGTVASLLDEYGRSKINMSPQLGRIGNGHVFKSSWKFTNEPIFQFQSPSDTVED